jgi:hypothetical protein
VRGCLLRVSEVQLNDPQTLYRRWTASQWRSYALDWLSRRLTVIDVPLESF